MKRFVIPLLVFSAVGCWMTAAWAASGAPIVKVAGGEVRGLEANGGAIFKGIPYAAPPSGALRWREPMPVQPWTGAKEAVEYGAPCAQTAGGGNDKVMAAASEDCLFLNVWTPEFPARSRKPVMVFLHGGGNTIGSAMGGMGVEPLFDGGKLAARGVVVVTINYRLGVLGFLAHPELTAESPHHSSGNYALLDQIAALGWVKENITRFGGDPAQVTVFGQSAGAVDIGLLLTSPLAKGLFVRAIAESSTVMNRGLLTPPLAEKEKAGQEMARRMGAPATGALAYMRKLSAAEVLKAVPPGVAVGAPLRPEPNIDGYVLPRLPAEVFRAGREMTVPLIIGNNAREGSIKGGPDAVTKAIQESYGSLSPQAAALYGANASAYPPYGDAGAQIYTDTNFRCGAVLTAAWHGARNPTWEYEFSHAYEPRGAAHIWELQYVFGFLTSAANQPTDRTLSDQVQEYWINFAKMGDPNGGSLPAWPKMDANRRYIEFSDDGPIVKSALRREACDLFQQKLEQDIAKASRTSNGTIQ